jgi:2-methylaconitate cis-trans-isomerase PrpF
MRGGTSKGLFFHASDLPRERAEWDRLFLAAMGSPDPYGRQLDGLGGGVSSVSKVVIISPPTHPAADVDYYFGQVAVDRALVDWGSTCGNLASAVGPFAVDEGLVTAGYTEAVVRIHAVNTHKLIHARFPTVNGKAAVRGELVLPGVSGSGSPVRLDFVDPSGTATGKLLPTGSPVDVLEVPGAGRVRVSLVDAGTACVFVAAAAFGLSGAESPSELDGNRSVMDVLEAVRCAAGVRMGIRGTIEEMRGSSPGTPKIAVVASPITAPLLNGQCALAEEMDISVRMLSMGQAHRAVPLTGALCLAVAARVEGSLVAEMARPRAKDIRVGTASGVFPVTADVAGPPDWIARSASVYRTARRLMAGQVLIPR